MKIICKTDDLKKVLNSVQRAVANKGILPVLSNILISSELSTGQYLKLSGTDLEIGIEAQLDAEILSPVHTTVPAKKLFEIVNKFPEDLIQLDFSAKDKVELSGNNLLFQLHTLAADDFPKLPQRQNEQPLELNLLAFAQAIRQTAFAAAIDSAKTILTGINVQVLPNEIKLASTDGYRLAVRTLSLNQTTEPFQMIVPKRTLVELEKLIKQDAQDSLLMSVSQNHIIFESQDKRLTSRLIEGKYPDYNKILPKQFERKVWIETKPFLAAVERIAIMASDQTHVVSFQIQTHKMIVTAGTEQGKAQEEMPIKSEGEPLTISFNAHYLIEVLRTYAEDSSHLLLQLNSEIKPVVISSVDNDDYLCMLMPILS